MQENKLQKIIAIGDIHGRDIWEQIIEKEKSADKIIFIGDYFDTLLPISSDLQIINFEKIISFKKENKNKVVLLLGNHDYHYVSKVNEIYSGFQKQAAFKIQDVVDAAVGQGFLQVCFVHENYLFTHAGVTKTWCNNNNVDLNNIEYSINNLFKKNFGAFKFTVGKNRSSYGDDITQCPLWVRPESLVLDGIDSYTQIVGHTQQSTINHIENYWFIDVLNKKYQYLKIIENEVSVMNIETKQSMVKNRDYIVITELPQEQQESLIKWLYGRTVPLIEEEGEDKNNCCYRWDYNEWAINCRKKF